MAYLKSETLQRWECWNVEKFLGRSLRVMVKVQSRCSWADLCSGVPVPKAIAKGVPNKDTKAYPTVNKAHKWHLGVSKEAYSVGKQIRTDKGYYTKLTVISSPKSLQNKKEMGNSAIYMVRETTSHPYCKSQSMSAAFSVWRTGLQGNLSWSRCWTRKPSKEEPPVGLRHPVIQPSSEKTKWD